MFAKSIVIFMLIFFSLGVSILLTFLAVFKVFWLSVSGKYDSVMCYCISIISSFGNIRTDFKIRFFLISITYWSGFGILEQSRDGWTVCKMSQIRTDRVMNGHRRANLMGSLQHPTAATTTKTSLKKWMLTALNLMTFILSRLIRRMLENYFS